VPSWLLTSCAALVGGLSRELRRAADTPRQPRTRFHDYLWPETYPETCARTLPLESLWGRRHPRFGSSEGPAGRSVKASSAASVRSRLRTS
jgi:hypothetical protein